MLVWQTETVIQRIVVVVIRNVWMMPILFTTTCHSLTRARRSSIPLIKTNRGGSNVDLERPC